MYTKVNFNIADTQVPADNYIIVKTFEKDGKCSVSSFRDAVSAISYASHSVENIISEFDIYENCLSENKRCKYAEDDFCEDCGYKHVLPVEVSIICPFHTLYFTIERV